MLLVFTITSVQSYRKYQSEGFGEVEILTTNTLYAVAARSKSWFCGRSPAEIVGSNPTGGVDVCRACCVFSGRGLCDGLITRPEESYRLWCVVACDLETS